jgi:signal transduction histidine kinase
VSVAVVALGATLTALYLARTGNVRPLLSHQALIPLTTLAYAGLGGLVASRQPRNVIGWLFLGTALMLSLNALSTGGTAYESLAGVNRLPWTDLLLWCTRWAWIPGIVLPGVVLMFFPDGRLPSRRWIPLVWLTALGLAGTIVAIGLHSGPIEAWDIPGPNPFGIPGAASVLEVVLNVSGALLGVCMVGALLALGLRFRRARGIERAQIKWVLYAAGVLTVAFGLAWSPATAVLGAAAAEEFGIVLSSLLILGIAAAVSVAILRHRLYDIDLVINRTLVYGALTVAVASLYVLVVGGLGLLLQARGSLALSLLGVGLVAFAAQPVRERLQRAVNRLMYGERDDPYAVLARLGQRLDASLTPEAVLPTIVETVAQALRLPYAAITLRQDEDFTTVAEYGRAASELFRLPLTHQGDTVGELVVSPRGPGDGFGAADRRLLDDLARRAGAAAHAVGLTIALQRSRERLVTTREEERRRLRRDLHDGLGSQLAALHLRAGTLRRQLPPGEPAAEAGLLELETGIHAAIGDIRRLVYELRPPALDELGLAGALRSLGAQCSTSNGLQVEVEAPEQFPPLPAAVEVAAYRIAQEALANVVRHAHAHTCQARLTFGDGLCLEIRDDGVGLPAVVKNGVGLGSMRQRAAELGGTCAVGSAPGGGARVLVRLPLLSNTA